MRTLKLRPRFRAAGGAAGRPWRSALALAVAGPLLLLGGPAAMLLSPGISLDGDWSTASREPAGIAPSPAEHPAALVQVYAARAFKWRGAFGVHTWIATKRRGAARYTVHHVLGWHVRHGARAVVSAPAQPDRLWFGSRPRVIAEARGARAGEIIDRIEQAVARYPHVREYRLWPGPNSNTFTAWVARRVPELGVVLPATAIGKDYLGPGRLFAAAPSGTGYQLSAFGALGVLAARAEGLELNVLGLTVGVDVMRPALKLPGIGRLGLPAARPH